MNLNLIEELILLALDDEKGSFVADSMSFNYGVAGSLILELSLRDKIVVVDKKVLVKNRRKTGIEILDKYFDKILSSKKDRSLEYWVNYIGDRANSIRKETLEILISKGILVEKKKKLLWLFTIKRYPTLNQKPEERLRKRLLDIVENNKKPEVNELMLLSLIDACDLNVEVFGKVSYNLHKLKVKSIIESSVAGKLINNTVKEIHDILMATIVTSMLVTVTVSS